MSLLLKKKLEKRKKSTKKKKRHATLALNRDKPGISTAQRKKIRGLLVFMLVLPYCNVDDPCFLAAAFPLSAEESKVKTRQRLLWVSTVADRAIRHSAQRLDS